MKRSTRLNGMMIYLKDKEAFNLADLMAVFGISRSTALRDVAALEELGMPVFSEPGRYGGYRILDNRQVPPMSFSQDEVFALYFAMLTLESYQSTPFHVCFASLKKKFAASISRANAARLAEMEGVLRLATVRHANESRWLKRLVEAAIGREVLKVVYRRQGEEEERHLQVMGILAREGEWYCEAFDFGRKAMRVFRCDRIVRVEGCRGFAPVDFAAMNDPYYELRDKDKRYYDFTVEVDDDGADIFRRESYPNMALTRDGGRCLIRGYYGEHEEAFMARYLMRYGKTIRSVDPPRLAAALRAAGGELLAHYETVLGGRGGGDDGAAVGDDAVDADIGTGVITPVFRYR